MIRKIIGILGPSKGKVVEAPYGGLSTKVRHFGPSRVLLITPKITQEEGSLLIKENWVAQNLSDPDHFNHFFAHVFHPQKIDPGKPVLILIPGILCNGNLFRISREGGNFRSLDQPLSFANTLANEGYHVITANPRYAKWIYTRYVEGKLGVKNYFSDAVDFEKLTQDIPFFIDLALGLTETQKAVVVGYSLGGMELLNYLARYKVHPRLSAAIFLATPGWFSREQLLIRLLRYYNWMARLTPFKNYHALKIAARNIIPVKSILKKAPPSLIEKSEIASEICNFSNLDPATVLPVLSYVLEPITSPLVDYFQFLARVGKLMSWDQKVDILETVSKNNLPSLFMVGENDKIVPTPSAKTPFNHIGGPKEFEVTPQAGHLDLVMGLNSQKTAEIILRFLSLHHP